MAMMQNKLVFTTPRPWSMRLLDALLEPSRSKATRLDLRSLPPYLRRDMGLLDPADRCDRPDRPPAGW